MMMAELRQVGGMTGDDLLKYVDISAMSLCTRCWIPLGEWHWAPGLIDWSDFPTKEQQCSCANVELKYGKSIEEGRWPEFDFNRVVELCHCCGADLILSGHKWSVLFCETCKGRVSRLNGQLGRSITPLGRHSLMSGIGLSGLLADEQEAIAEFLEQAEAFSGRLKNLGLWKDEIAARNASKTGFRSGEPLGLAEYLSRAGEAAGDRLGAFRDMCDWRADSGVGQS